MLEIMLDDPIVYIVIKRKDKYIYLCLFNIFLPIESVIKWSV